MAPRFSRAVIKAFAAGHQFLTTRRQATRLASEGISPVEIWRIFRGSEFVAFGQTSPELLSEGLLRSGPKATSRRKIARIKLDLKLL